MTSPMIDDNTIEAAIEQLGIPPCSDRAYEVRRGVAEMVEQMTVKLGVPADALHLSRHGEHGLCVTLGPPISRVE